MYIDAIISCLCTFWSCHRYFILQFYSIVFILVTIMHFFATYAVECFVTEFWILHYIKISWIKILLIPQPKTGSFHLFHGNINLAVLLYDICPSYHFSDPSSSNLCLNFTPFSKEGLLKIRYSCWWLSACNRRTRTGLFTIICFSSLNIIESGRCFPLSVMLILNPFCLNTIVGRCTCLWTIFFTSASWSA